MAVEIGTASSQVDLLNKLKTFLTTNATLVGLGQEWACTVDEPMEFKAALTTRIAWDTNHINRNSVTAPDAAHPDIPKYDVMWLARGQIDIPLTGDYYFGLDANGWANVVIDGTAVVGRYAGSGLSENFTTSSGMINLTAGLHDIEVRACTSNVYSVFTDNSLAVALAWKKPGDASYAVIPAASYSSMTQWWQTFHGIGPTNAGEVNRVFNNKYMRFVGPGMGGTDAIYLDVGSHSDPSQDMDHWQVRYGIGENAEGLIGRSGGEKWVTLWNSTTPYWFIANGRRFIVVAKVSTEYAVCYGGFFLPYALPDEYPYPIAAGANSGVRVRFSTIGDSRLRPFWHPRSTDSIDANTQLQTSLSIRRPSGNELGFNNLNTNTYARTYPYYGDVQMRPAVAGEYILTPVMLFNADGDCYGEFHGVFHVNGFSLSSEDVVVIDAKNYLVVAGIGASTTGYAAILLE